MEAETHVRITYELYPRSAVDLAVAHFSELCSIGRSEYPGGVELSIRQDSSGPAEMVDEFLNFMLLAAIEHHSTQ